MNASLFMSVESKKTATKLGILFDNANKKGKKMTLPD